VKKSILFVWVMHCRSQEKLSRKDAKKRIFIARESLQNIINATPMCCAAAQKCAGHAKLRAKAGL